MHFVHWKTCMRINNRGVPICHPETVLYYALCYLQNLRTCSRHISYEILRNNSPDLLNEMEIAFRQDCFNATGTGNDRAIAASKIKLHWKNIKTGGRSLLGLAYNIIMMIYCYLLNK